MSFPWTFLYGYGVEPRICISDPEVAKHVLSSKFGFYFKPQLRPRIETLADIIAHTAFGSSFAEGRETLEAQAELQECCAASISDIFIPGSQHLYNGLALLRQIWKLDRKVKETLRSIIESRLKAPSKGISDRYGDDLLGVMIKCVHQDWQAKLREEVLEYCGIGIPDADILSNLKLVNMVLLEALRLYSPDTWIVIPVFKIQKDKKYWIEDAEEFSPLRFINGVTKAARNPNAMLAFGAGPRACIAKTAIALILEKFSFSLSPDYKHTPPGTNLVLRHQNGLPVVVMPLR
ncbi:cytochrome P450 709B2 [Citrus sinensis]|uniref:Cytochrome P450 709B2 n=2 Tax=Citrus TaxID=2706 RepID=A0ACB8MN83_CITSI|nr:hypothetical protein CICLE_v10024398mg [Citrus x clementina]KAH9731053.1 cytochrome P450 709B2 [Citrus sinensis]KAH9787061.1 cytochrome P450 709B2 [Citrus sinensis]